MRTKRKRKTTVAARIDRERTKKKGFYSGDSDSGKGGTDIEAHCGLGHVGKKLLFW